MRHLLKWAIFLLAALFVPALDGIDLNRRGGINGSRRRQFGHRGRDHKKTSVSVAVILPHSMFKEREYKKKLNSEFRNFCRAAQQQHDARFEKPERGLGFYGVP